MQRSFVLSDREKGVSTKGLKKYRSFANDSKFRLRQAFNKTARVFKMVVAGYFDHNVGRSSAALAYFFIFAIFPLLIFFSSFLGALNLDVVAIVERLSSVLPHDIVSLLGSYLDYVSHSSSKALMWFSLVFTIYFPMRAAKCLMDGVREAYRLPLPANPVSYFVRQFVYTIMLLIVIVVTALVVMSGKTVLSKILDAIPLLRESDISYYILMIWYYLRYMVLGVVMLAVLSVLYSISLDGKNSVLSAFPGTISALIVWMAATGVFSVFVNNYATYSLIYGAFGAIIALLIWLYLTATILILGAELNAAIGTVRAVDRVVEDDGLDMRFDSCKKKIKRNKSE